MKKPKKKISKVWKYLREVSVVVLGVAITLTTSVLIQDYKDNKALNHSLEAVILELETNIKSLEYCIESWQRSVGYATYLQSNDMKKLNMDSIRSGYGNDVYYNRHFFSYSSDAFEMFKNSGILRLIRDQQVQLSLWRAYSELNTLKQILDESSNFKSEEIKKDAFNASRELIIPMYNFYAKTGISGEMVKTSKETSETLKEIVLKLEGYKKGIE